MTLLKIKWTQSLIYIPFLRDTLLARSAGNGAAVLQIFPFYQVLYHRHAFRVFFYVSGRAVSGCLFVYLFIFTDRDHGRACPHGAPSPPVSTAGVFCSPRTPGGRAPQRRPRIRAMGSVPERLIALMSVSLTAAALLPPPHTAPTPSARARPPPC